MANVVITGGDKLENHLAKLAKNLSKSATLKVGWLENKQHADSNITVPTVAAIQEFGAPSVGIPPRLGFRQFVKDKSKSWGKGVALALERNDFDAVKALEQVGEGIDGQLRQHVADIYEPALSPVTIMLRQMKRDTPGLKITRGIVNESRKRVAQGIQPAGNTSTKPLVDTGELIGSISHNVD